RCRQQHVQFRPDPIRHLVPLFPHSPERHGPAIVFNQQVGAGCKPQPLAPPLSVKRLRNALYDKQWRDDKIVEYNNQEYAADGAMRNARAVRGVNLAA
ncbi:hypothetical protein, partial [Sinorhizobium meliloti]